MVFAWQQKDIINGNEHSVAFLLLTFFLAIVDCTSSVLYTPFMSSVPSKFLVAHLIGQALSGLVPSFTALAQGNNLFIVICLLIAFVYRCGW